MYKDDSKKIKASEAINKAEEWMLFLCETDCKVCYVRDYLEAKKLEDNKIFALFLALNIAGYEIEFD